MTPCTTLADIIFSYQSMYVLYLVKWNSCLCRNFMCWTQIPILLTYHILQISKSPSHYVMLSRVMLFYDRQAKKSSDIIKMWTATTEIWKKFKTATDLYCKLCLGKWDCTQCLSNITYCRVVADRGETIYGQMNAMNRQLYLDSELLTMNMPFRRCSTALMICTYVYTLYSFQWDHLLIKIKRGVRNYWGAQLCVQNCFYFCLYSSACFTRTRWIPKKFALETRLCFGEECQNSNFIAWSMSLSSSYRLSMQIYFANMFVHESILNWFILSPKYTSLKLQEEYTSLKLQEEYTSLELQAHSTRPCTKHKNNIK